MMTRDQSILAIGQDTHDLQSLIGKLWAFRLNPETTHLLAAEEGNLWAALGSLRGLVMDIRETEDTEQREAAE